MTIHEAQQRLLFQLYNIYDDREAANIADLVMEHITGWSKVDRILNKQVPLRDSTVVLFEKYTSELMSHTPVQYVLKEAWFCGMKFGVNQSVLIPRPETEELVEWIVYTIKKSRSPKPIKILDVGTGSGCIAIALKKRLLMADIIACDISFEALDVAKQNAISLAAEISFLQLNFLDETEWSRLPDFDIIVSNPPYIPEKDAGSMHRNVLDFEPHVALFVDNNDPLVFYNAIAKFAEKKLESGGWIFAEIHEAFGAKMNDLFAEKGFANVELKKDLQGKDRMLRIAR